MAAVSMLCHRVVMLFVLLIWILLDVHGSSILTSNQDITSLASRRYYKPGNVTIGGLFPVHTRTCNDINLRPEYLGLAEAMVFAVNEINNSPDLLPNVSLGFDIYDTCLDKRLTMRSALEFVNLYNYAAHSKYWLLELNSSKACRQEIIESKLRAVSAVVGTGTSSTSTLVANLLQVADIPLVSYAATSDKLSNTKEFPTFFRTVPPDRFQSKAMVDIAKHFNWSYVAAIGTDETYGRSGIEFFKSHAKPRGICVETEKYFPHEANSGQKEIQNIIAELKNKEKKARVIILYCNKINARKVMREAATQGLVGRTWIASEAWVNDNVFEGLSHNVSSVVKGLLGVSFPKTRVNSFKEHMLRLNSSYVPNQWWKALWKSPLWEKEYNCKFDQSSQSKSVTKKCPDFLQITEKTFSEFYDVKDAAVIDAVYAIAKAIDWTHRCKKLNGTFSLGKCAVTHPFTEPEDVLHYLPHIKMKGPISQISFDQNGDYPADYTIHNLQLIDGKRWLFKEVGSWNQRREKALDIHDNSVIWNDQLGLAHARQFPKSVCSEVCKPGNYQVTSNECCWKCAECPQNEISNYYGAKKCTPCNEGWRRNDDRTDCLKIPIRFLTISSTSGIVIMILTGMGIIATIFIAGVFIKYNSTPIVKAANRELSYLLLICIGLAYCSSVIYLWEPTMLSCALYKPCFFFLDSTILLVLGVKTRRIVNLFQTRMPNSNRKKGILIKYSHIWIVAVVDFVIVIVLIIWMAVDHPFPYINKNLKTEYIKECKSYRSTTGKICSYLLTAILVLLCLICCFFAFKARKLPHNFNEAKFIGFSIYVASVSWFTYYPVYSTIESKYKVLLSCGSTIITASGMLVCLFAPKVYIILRYPNKNTTTYMKAQITDHTFRRNVVKDRARTLSTYSVPTSESPNLTLYSRSSPRNSHVQDSPKSHLRSILTNNTVSRTQGDRSPKNFRLNGGQSQGSSYCKENGHIRATVDCVQLEEISCQPVNV